MHFHSKNLHIILKSFVTHQTSEFCVFFQFQRILLWLKVSQKCVQSDAFCLFFTVFVLSCKVYLLYCLSFLCKTGYVYFLQVLFTPGEAPVLATPPGTWPTPSEAKAQKVVQSNPPLLTSDEVAKETTSNDGLKMRPLQECNNNEPLMKGSQQQS